MLRIYRPALFSTQYNCSSVNAGLLRRRKSPPRVLTEGDVVGAKYLPWPTVSYGLPYGMPIKRPAGRVPHVTLRMYSSGLSLSSDYQSI